MLVYNAPDPWSLSKRMKYEMNEKKKTENILRRLRRMLFATPKRSIWTCIWGVPLLIFVALFLSVSGKIRFESPHATPLIEDWRGRYLSEGWSDGSPRGFWEVAGGLPERLTASFIAIEDKRFAEHSGIDWRAVGRSVINNIKGGSRHGASTIAMQTARMQNRGARNYWNKMQEMLIARLLVLRYGREAVMRQYLRLAPQGNSIHGVAYAARRYFRKPIQDLGWAESALLASLPKAPGRMNLFNSRGFLIARDRARIVLAELFRQDRINATEYRASLRHLRLMSPPSREFRPISSCHAIIRMEKAWRQSRSSDGKAGRPALQRPLRSSIDLDLQQFLNDIAREALKEARPHGAGNIAIIIADKKTGLLRAYLGSEDYFSEKNAGSIDYADTPRSSGSTLKPFIYALGLENRKFTPSSVLADLPYYVAHPSGQYSVGNYDGLYLGPLIYRKALANSRNVPAVTVLRGVGLEQAHRFFQETGLERNRFPPRHYGLGLALGGVFVTLTDLVRAYGVLANDGRDFQLSWFEEPEEALVSGRRILSSASARRIALYLSDPQARMPTFKRMGSLEYPFPAAVKTGTSQGFRDAWAVAWSGKFIVGAWLGHPKNDRMNQINGAAAAAVVQRVMLHLHPGESQGVNETPFLTPAGYHAVKICALSGQRATELCSEVLMEYYSASGAPVSACRMHRRFLTDRVSGEPVTGNTPAKSAVLKTYVVLPPEYAAWAAAQGLEKPPVPQTTFPVAAVEINNPVHNTRLVLDPETPRKFQTLALRASVTPATPAIVWIVDGKPTPPAPYPYVYHWPLEKGRHTFQARFPHADVRSGEVTVFISE